MLINAEAIQCLIILPFCQPPNVDALFAYLHNCERGAIWSHAHRQKPGRRPASPIAKPQAASARFNVRPSLPAPIAASSSLVSTLVSGSRLLQLTAYKINSTREETPSLSKT